MTTPSDATDERATRPPGPDPAAPGRWQDLGSATLAFALYGVLIDAAVETWWSGSPVRWWIVATVTADAVATALMWRRMTWRSQAAISAFVLLGVLAITAWMPGGLTAGVRLAGGTTSTLLSLLTAAAVALAASVVWRFRAVPLAARTLVGVLAAYGLTALVFGIVTRVPFPALFSGDSLWQRLPAFLQGAFVGGLVVLPLAFLTSVVRAGIPRFREGSPRCGLYQIVALGTSLAIVLAALPLAVERRNRGGATATTAGFNVPELPAIVPSAARSDALDNSLRAVEDGERESPRDRWDPAYIVEQVGKDPQQLFDWVTGHTNWIPYRGLLRGPVGVLMDRMGNSLDRAVLLATLLRTAGHSVRLAHGELSADRAMGLLPALIVARTGDIARDLRLKQSAAADVQQVAARYSLNGPAVAQAVSSSALDGERVFSSLDVRVADQTARLRAAVGKRLTADDVSGRFEAASTLLRDHWWVQRQDGVSWMDLDLLSPDMTAMTPALETVALDALAPSQVHQVIVRVVAEQWNEGKVSERVALQHTLLPAELIGKPITLRLWPRRWPATVNPGPNPSQFLRTTALAQHEWLATLQIGRDVAAQSSLRENGEINDHPALNDFAEIGGRAAGAAGDVASMLRGVAPDPAATPARPSMLTAAWFEFEVRTPGEPPRTTRRAVFDLLGASARASVPVPQIALDDNRSLTRSLSLMMETEILPVACRLAPEFFRHLVGESLLSNREVLRALVRGEISDTTPKPDELASRLMPIPGPLYPLALARFDRSRFGDQIYLVAPNVLTRHVFFAPRGGDRIALWDATDIVANEVGVDLRVKDAFAVRFEQGVLDTNAEAHLQRGAAVVGSPANAFAVSSDWVTLTSASDPQLAGLRFSDDDRRSIARDLVGGSVVVAPRGPVRVGSEDFVGWWRIDPARGDVLGVDRRGWGQAAGEYMMLVTAAMTGFYVTWLMCRVPPPSAPGAPVARGHVPGLDQLVAPLAAAGDACIAAAIDGAILGAILGLMSMSSGSGASGAGGGKGGSGGGTGSGGGGTGKGGGGTGGGGGGTGSGGGAAGGGGAGGRGAGGGGGGNGSGGGSGGPAGAGAGGRGGTQPMTTEVTPNQELELANTGAGQAAPRTTPATAAEVADAKSGVDAAQAEATQATKDYVNYRSLKPNPGRDVAGDPSYDPTVDEALQNEMMQKAAARNDALLKLQQAQEGLPRGIPAGRGGGFPPPRPAPQPPDVLGCPPNCGNDNKTGPAENVQVPGQNKNVVGVAGVSNVLSGR